MTDRQPDPAPGADPERGFVVAVLARSADPTEELAEIRGSRGRLVSSPSESSCSSVPGPIRAPTSARESSRS